MMIKGIRKLPKYMVARIKKYDLQNCPDQKGYTRFYCYLVKQDKELVKYTVAVRNYRKQWFCKQVVVHALHSKRCYITLEYSLANHKVLQCYGHHDSNGMFEKLWQFSSYLLQKGFEIIEVSKQENMLDINIKPIKENSNKLLLRTYATGKPEHIKQTINGQTYSAIKIGDKIYIPNK